MKYIIDVPEEVVNAVENREGYWNLLHFSRGITDAQTSPVKLIPYNEKYFAKIGDSSIVMDINQVEDEVWGLAQKLDKFNNQDWRECFGEEYMNGLANLPYREAKEKYEKYMVKGFHIGEELESQGGLVKGIIIQKNYKTLYLLDLPFLRIVSIPYDEVNEYHKTGRKFKQIDELIEAVFE